MASTAITAYASRVNEYVAGRPEYPAAVLCDLPVADTIIELGAGTGKFTELLARTGKRILAVEPIQEMAARIRGDHLANVNVLIGSAEAIPTPDHAAGLICCATAFHWFDYAKATSEIVRVLVQGGALALVWNVLDDRVPWVAEFSRLLDSYAGNSPRQVRGNWRVIFEDARFEHLASTSYPFTQPMPTSGILDRALSSSFIAMLPHEEQEIVCAKVEAIIENEPLLAVQDLIQFPYVTHVHVFRARS